MYRLANGTQVQTQPTPQVATGTPGFATYGEINGQPASDIDPDRFNDQQEELMSILAAAEIEPAIGVQNQVLTALQKLFLQYGKVGLGNWTEQYYTLAASGNKTISLTFTAPCAGYLHLIASANFSSQNTSNTLLTTSVNGTQLSSDNVSGTTAMTNHACVAVAAGSVTVSSYLGTSSSNPPTVGHTLSYLFVPS